MRDRLTSLDDLQRATTGKAVRSHVLNQLAHKRAGPHPNEFASRTSTVLMLIGSAAPLMRRPHDGLPREGGPHYEAGPH